MNEASSQILEETFTVEGMPNLAWRFESERVWMISPSAQEASCSAQVPSWRVVLVRFNVSRVYQSGQRDLA